MNRTTITSLIAALIIGFGIGYLLFNHPERVETEPENVTQREILYYRNPMNPSVTSPVPAKDSMGMDYIPVYADSANKVEIAGTVEIDPVVVQSIGVRTAKAERKSLSRAIKTVGRVDFDEGRMVNFHPKVEGWVEKIHIDKTGQNVEPGDLLLSMYSPILVSAQQEYLLALNNQAALNDSPFEQIRNGARDLVGSARQRLELFDLPEHQIRNLEKTDVVDKYVHIHAPWSGTVIRIGARAGQFVSPKTELYMLVDLSRVWVYADIFEYELPWVRVRDSVEMKLTSVPGKTFRGVVSYIYPYAENDTRSTKVRLEFDNTAGLLRPDMFSDITIFSDEKTDAVVIPAEAVVRSGTRTQAFVVRGSGKFEPRDIEVGIESQGLVAVLAGVEVGEEVVVSAQFLVDSESKLREATAKMMDVLNSTNDLEKYNHSGHEKRSPEPKTEEHQHD